jgi:hypothetical protein
MHIVVKTTKDWESGEWITYVQSFNQVFDKNCTVDDFKQKYFNTIDGFSFHSLLMKEQQIVGSCTAIPYEYFVGNNIIRAALVVDVFIAHEYRNDPYSLYQIYQKLKEKLILHNISLVLAVPNDLIYPYWKSVVKWKDIGFLKYYALPVRLGNVISKNSRLLNGLSSLASKMLLGFSGLSRTKEQVQLIRMNRANRIFEKQRYTSDHRIVDDDRHFFTYRNVREKNIDTCYLIDFFNKRDGKRDSSSLTKAIRHICSEGKPALILFIGKLTFFQLLLFRIPSRMEPRKLFFMADILIPNPNLDPELIYRFKNWDFGLFNFDVR